MPNTQAMANAFKAMILRGAHAFGDGPANTVRTLTTKDTFNIALYLSSASLGAATSSYTSSGELANTGNYSTSGKALTNGNDVSTNGTSSFWTPSASVTWSNLTSSGIFDAALIYNATATNKNSVSVHTFSAQSITAADFTLTMPTHDGASALIRIT